MEWIAVISCIYSHTLTGKLFCWAYKDQEASYDQKTEEQCVKWAEDYLTEKYHVHHGQFEWGYKCIYRPTHAPYKPKRLEQGQ